MKKIIVLAVHSYYCLLDDNMPPVYKFSFVNLSTVGYDMHSISLSQKDIVVR